MPTVDEDLVRDLLRRYTRDVHPAPPVAREVATRQRRRERRHRVASVAATGAALGTAAGLIATAGGHSAPAPGGRTGGTSALGGSRPVVRLTADQRVLYHLSSAAAGQRQGTGRYAVMSTEGDHLKDTSVIDSRTGDMWSYQKGTDGNPSGSGFTRHYSLASAKLAAMPTSRAALRAALIAQWDEQNKPAPDPVRAKGPHLRRIPVRVSADDKVFQQASDMLWNPLVSPALRAALYKVLAAVPGVTVNPGAHDGIGRPAVEISRVDSSGLPGGKSDGITYATYENPKTGAVLESTVTYPPGSDIVTPQDPTGSSTVVDTIVYLRVTWASAVPADPYAR